VRITGNNLQDRVTLTWTDLANSETGFQIQRSISPNFTNPTTFNVGANVTTFNQNVLRAFNFYYRVRAVNAVGNSGWSNVLFVTTP
jgi:titin